MTHTVETMAVLLREYRDRCDALVQHELADPTAECNCETCAPTRALLAKLNAPKRGK
jgi:hypothetical protein